MPTYAKLYSTHWANKPAMQPLVNVKKCERHSAEIQHDAAEIPEVKHNTENLELGTEYCNSEC